jgi:inactivated superfamily I helicase
MKFLNEAVRREFHLLPADKQTALNDCDFKFAERKLEIMVLHVAIIDNKTSEISMKIDHILKGDCPLLS